MQKQFILLTILYIVMVCFKPPVETIKITSLKTTVREHPFFSWQISSVERNQFQSAFEIQVAHNASDLNESKNLAWTSGKVESDRSILVEAVSMELKPAQTYYWRVKVWDQDKQESGWSETAAFSTGLLQEKDWMDARWIGYEDLLPENVMIPGVHGNGEYLGKKCTDRPVVPVLRMEFEADREIAGATLYICGLGHYEAMINGQKVGNSFLSPGWTNYDKTVLYNVYDVGQMLREGRNAIAALIGNGFYNINRERYRKLVISWGNPKLLAQLRIRYSDGTEQILVTDTSWKTAPSPITFSSIYGGEDFNAGLEQNGWDKSGFNDKSWRNAVPVNPPRGKLTVEKDYPIQIMEVFDTRNIIRLKNNCFLYDFGQNASGIIELRLKGKKGQVVRLTPSELITSGNEPNQSASGSPYYFSYTLKGNGIETWRPRFSYYGFRYVKIEGAVPSSEKKNQGKAEILDLKMLHSRNSTASTGTFACSNELFNRTFSLINWGIKSNLQSVLTDCPHREKLGWLEQTYLMGSSVHFNFDIYELYCKQVIDMIESQLENGLVPDIAPEYVPFEDGFRDSPEWGSASVILPWLLYKWYGDTSVMQKAWPMMIRYVEYLGNKSDNQILSHGLGDWFDYGPRQPGEAQLTPKALTATAIYYYDVKLLSEMAAVLNKADEKEKLEKWADEIKSAFNAKFFDTKTCVISTGSQTAMAMPWCVGLVDGQYKARVLQNLEDSIRSKGKPLTAGDVGFRYLVEALTFGGKSQLLFEMNARDDVPGYGFQLRKGATALTESWPALENVSNNHLMLGHLMDWFYAGLGGISQTAGSVAYKEIIIKPEFVGDIKWVKTSFKCPYGIIRSEWDKNGTTIKMKVSIPANTIALVYIPCKAGSEIKESQRNLSEIKEIKIIGEENGRKICLVGSGDYEFESSVM